MKITIELDSIEENDKVLLMANADKILLALWEFRYNTKKIFEWSIDSKSYDTQYDLLDAIFEEFWETFPNIEIE